MKINGWDIKEAHAKQRRLKVGHHKIKPNSEWNAGSNRPVFSRPDLDFKEIHVEIMVEGSDYANIVRNTGIILGHLLTDVVINFDRYGQTSGRYVHSFHCVLDKQDVEEKSKDRWHILKLDFIGYEYTSTIRNYPDSSLEFEIENPGTVDSPVILYITPTTESRIGDKISENTYTIEGEDGSILYSVGEQDESGDFIGYEEVYGGLKIEGLCYDPITGEPAPIVVHNYTLGKTICINGETGLVMEDGVPKIADVDMWSLPTVKPGINVVKTNGDYMDIIVEVAPRYI